jgi:2-dehydropantoate 2-reductase
MTLKIGIVGAGSIGCFVGGCLMMSGPEKVHVAMLGRESIGGQLAEHGLSITDFRGLSAHFSAQEFVFSTDPAALRDMDYLIVTVKSGATEEVAGQLAEVIDSRATVISLQNGVGNAETLARLLPDNTVLPGMIAFNVLQQGQGRFHAGTDGAIIMQEASVTTVFAELLRASGVPFQCHANMQSVLWSKLLLNLNNPINALSGIPLKEELSQRAYRRCLALLQEEAMDALKAANIPLQKLTGVSPRLLPTVLRLPDWLFTLLAQRMLAVDPLARSSMWEDLERGRKTELDWLNGEVVKLGQRHGVATPVNSRLIRLVRDAEQGGRRDYSGRELLQRLSRG